MEEKKEAGWSTQKELEFIKHLITETGKSAIDSLSGYVAGIAKRTAWGDLDRENIVNYAKSELEKLQASQT